MVTHVVPLVRIELPKGKPAGYREAIADAAHGATAQELELPRGDRFPKGPG
jgi:4-oxalocrotonate tautomerase